MKYITLILIFALSISCNKSEEVNYTVKNEQQIKEYLKANNLTAQKSTSGLYYIINEEGTGTRPSLSSKVTVAYKGYYTNGEVFDKSDANGISFSLQGVIRGWTEGITYFKEGGNGVLLVPSSLGYGSADYNGIPGGSVLVFDIILISVN